jgi:hypothetical protein
MNQLDQIIRCREKQNGMGNPKQKGSITLGHVYANALDAASEHLFWATAAQEDMVAIGLPYSRKM